MVTKIHPLLSDAPGTHRAIESHHFGLPGAQPRIYIQAALHADEIPGMLVAVHLRAQLEALDAAGRVTGEIVLVPVANPIGLAQGLLHENIGRFELGSAQNFNRHYPDLAALAGDRLATRLGSEAAANQRIVRAALAEALAETAPRTELDVLRQVLLGLALDADMVLDMHCDLESLCHLYTTDTSRDWGAQLSAHIGAQVVLLSPVSGGNAFDEACSTPWDALRARYGATYPIPVGCQATTIEWRGLADVDEALCAADAQHLVSWLANVGAVAGDAAAAPAHAPGDLVPLAGTDDLVAPFGGIVSFCRAVGERVHAGDVIAVMIDPLSGRRAQITTRNDGLLYAREHRRFLRRGTSVAQVSGAVPIRSGDLLSAR